MIRFPFTIALVVACVASLHTFAADTYQCPAAKKGGPIVVKVVMVEDEDEKPAAAGKAAAEALKKAMG